MASAGGSAVVRFIDHSGEGSSVTVITNNLTAGNFATKLAQYQALVSAIEGVNLGTLNQSQLTAFVARGSNVPPTNSAAQREIKWLVSYQDNQQYLDPPTNVVVNNGFGKLFSIEIPCADPSLVRPNTDIADLLLPAWTAFIAAFEAFALSPYGGSVKVVGARLVGRAL